MNILDRLKKKFVEWLFSSKEEIILKNVRILNLKVGKHTIKIKSNQIEIDGKVIIDGSTGKIYIKNIDGLQLPVGSDKYVP